MIYREYKNNRKDKKSILLVIMLVFVAILGVVAVRQHKVIGMLEYATQNNCTWHANGTFYGDNRDYVCK